MSDARYLVRTGSAVIKADGTATVKLAPAVSEFWTVVLVRVSASEQPQSTFLISYPYCAVYQGPVGVISPATFLDDTTLGSGDSTSIISGTVTLYGEAITASWSQGIPGDTVTLTVYGRSWSNLPDIQSQMAPVPGARFAGTTGNGMVWEYNSSTQAGPTNFATPPVFITPGNSDIEIVAVHLKVTTSAAAGSRVIGIRVRGTIGLQPNTDLFVVANGTGQAPSTVITYVFGQGMFNYSAAGNTGCAIPTKVIIPPISTLDTLRSGIDAGDTWSEFTITYRRYTTLSKVSYT